LEKLRYSHSSFISNNLCPLLANCLQLKQEEASTHKSAKFHAVSVLRPMTFWPPK